MEEIRGKEDALKSKVIKNAWMISRTVRGIGKSNKICNNK